MQLPRYNVELLHACLVELSCSFCWIFSSSIGGHVCFLDCSGCPALWSTSEVCGGEIGSKVQPTAYYVPHAACVQVLAVIDCCKYGLLWPCLLRLRFDPLVICWGLLLARNWLRQVANLACLGHAFICLLA